MLHASDDPSISFPITEMSKSQLIGFIALMMLRYQHDNNIPMGTPVELNFQPEYDNIDDDWFLYLDKDGDSAVTRWVFRYERQ